jgi:26S proteasome regulatory subunit N9
LWHQLTLKLFEFFEHPLSKRYRVDVRKRFVRDFDTKINQLRLAEMGVKVSKVIASECHVVVVVSDFDGELSR